MTSVLPLPPDASSSLCPGYKHVDAFGPPEEYEDEIEEDVAYVTLDLGSIEPTLVPSSSTYRLIGLDTTTPFLQLSGTILKGKHETLLGTELIFTEAKDIHAHTSTDHIDPRLQEPPPPPPQVHKKTGAAHTLTHVAGTSQRICFREVRLQPREASTQATTSYVHGRNGGSDKGKNRDVDDIPGDLATEVEAATLMVDRVTGKNAPRARAARTKSSAGVEKKQGGNVTDEASASANTGTRQTRGRKAKEKGKEKAKELIDGLAMDVDADGDGDRDEDYAEENEK
ncbi:hypothetical protein DXG03_003493 [Asterophora parasitica]|uniref:Transcription factor TFIIIC triple barrel domain-containing protein n=1 Tax=Asterophora parasitica TaxID=117018 RepID=A0A9P7GD08_9AGAR|nr:hypothetical protein DXG03_003493 [Asterophora parasitica]